MGKEMLMDSSNAERVRGEALSGLGICDGNVRELNGQSLQGQSHECSPLVVGDGLGCVLPCSIRLGDPSYRIVCLRWMHKRHIRWYCDEAVLFVGAKVFME